MAAQYGWALTDFDGDVANNQLNFSKGDVLLVTHKQEGGWWFGTTHKDGKNGYFPETFVKLHSPTDTDGTTKSITPTTTTDNAPQSSGEPSARPTAPTPTPTPTSTNTWVAVFDARYNRNYYQNRTTGESSWEKPPGFVETVEKTVEKVTKSRQSSPSVQQVTKSVKQNKLKRAETLQPSTTTPPAKQIARPKSERDVIIQQTASTKRTSTNSTRKKLNRFNSITEVEKRHLGIAIEEDIVESDDDDEVNDGKTDDTNETKLHTSTPRSKHKSTHHKGDDVQPKELNYKSFAAKLIAIQSSGISSFTAHNRLPQGWLNRVKNSKSVFSSNPFKREYFIVVPKDKRGGDLVLCRFKKEPINLKTNSSATPQDYQKQSSEVYDLSKSSTGISVTPANKTKIETESLIRNGGVPTVYPEHVFHVMEKDAVASMILAADTKEDAERWVHTLREILRIGRARNIEMPEDDATLNRLCRLVLRNLALPVATQTEMMNTMQRKQKWQLILLNRNSLESQALAAAIQGETSLATANTGSYANVDADAEKWAERTLKENGKEMRTISGIRALKAAVATSGLRWLQSFHKAGGISGVLVVLRTLGEDR